MIRLLPLLALLPLTPAEFTTPFTSITHGRRHELKWDRLEPSHLPAYLAGRFFNKTDSGVTSFQSNISTDLTGTSFVWINAPYPLPYVATAEYELELRPQDWDVEAQGEVPLLAQSGLFAIHAEGEGESGGGGGGSSGGLPTIGAGPQETDDKGSGKPSTTVIIAAVCVGLGIPILAGIGVWFWCMRRQKKRIAYQESRKRRFETVIH